MCFSVTSWKISSGPAKPPDESEQGHTWSQGKFPGRLSGSSKLAMGITVYVNGFLSLCTSPVIDW